MKKTLGTILSCTLVLGTFTSAVSSKEVQASSSAVTDSAREVAYKMLQKIKSIGKVKWNAQIKLYIASLPISENNKKILQTYLSYDVVVKILTNVITSNLSINTALSNEFKKLGLSSSLSNLAAGGISILLN